MATSERFGVLCRFTAWVAVDDRVVTEGGEPHRVIQPVEMPAGWEMPMPARGAVDDARGMASRRSRPRRAAERAADSALLDALPAAALAAKRAAHGSAARPSAWPSPLGGARRRGTELRDEEVETPATRA